MDSERFFLHANAFYGFCWNTIVTVNLVFMVKVAGLDPLQMVLVGTVLEGSVFLFEIPTGVVADAVSRRLSVIIGHALTGLGFLVLALFPTFGMILLSQVIWGIGATFISGAYAAWLTDEVGVARVGDVFLHAAQRRQIGGALGIVVSVALAQYSLQLPVIVGSIGVLALSLAMWAWMRETGFVPVPAGQRTTWQVMGATFRAGLAEFSVAPLLGLIFAITLIYGAFSEGLDRLFTPFLLGRFEFPKLGPLDDVVWWGIIAMVSSLVGLAATTLARRFVDTTSHAAVTWGLGLFTAAIGAAVVALANVDSFIAVLVFFWLASGLRAARGPLTTTWLNHHLPSHSRATLLSIMGQADAVGQTAGGPVIGFVAKEISIAVALTGSALLLLPSLFLYRRAAGLGTRSKP
jgi:DHA3 family tetracycline resistance protein-like MFS transporter